MKFMCDEMREGLLAGKKYRRPWSGDESNDIEAFMTCAGELRYKLVNDEKSVGGMTNDEDMTSEWDEVNEYTLTFLEAMAAMNEGKTVENDNKCPYRIEVSDDSPVLCFMYEGKWLTSMMPINELMEWKWRIVE